MSSVQFRDPDIVLTDKMTAIPKANAAGVLLVDAAAPSPAAFAETPFATLDVSGYDVVTLGPQVACVLVKLYVGMPEVLVGAGPYYVVILDVLGAPVGGERSVVPTPKITAAGQLYFFEPPGGAKFDNGIAVALSSTPVLYTAVGELCSVKGWTVL